MQIICGCCSKHRLSKWKNVIPEIAQHKDNSHNRCYLSRLSIYTHTYKHSHIHTLRSSLVLNLDYFPTHFCFTSENTDMLHVSALLAALLSHTHSSAVSAKLQSSSLCCIQVQRLWSLKSPKSNSKNFLQLRIKLKSLQYLNRNISFKCSMNASDLLTLFVN